MCLTSRWEWNPHSPTFTSTPTSAATCSENTLLSRERPAAIPHLVVISTLASGSKLKAP